VQLPFKAGELLATGAELKNTFCLTRDGFSFLSQHIGDMENLETLEHFEASIMLFQHLFRIEPALVAHDLHPDYSATKFAEARDGGGESLVPIQHHQAHIAACLVDNGWLADEGPVIGVAWDGTGYGTDGHVWGGEFFVGDYGGLHRAAHLEYLPMPGGDAAIRNPWRLALGYLYTLTGQIPNLPGVGDEEERIVRQQIDQGLNTPLTSAAGRLFDAVAALIGIRQRVTYEAQAAIEMEMQATQWFVERPSAQPDAYPFEIESDGGPLQIRLRELLMALQADVTVGVGQAEIGFKFHQTLTEIILAVCQRLADETGLRTVALSGGCFQNRLLLALSVPRLEESGFRVLLHRRVPCNDGGISLGQVAMAGFAALKVP
jgi:hydrogenase maturation protein HypF